MSENPADGPDRRDFMVGSLAAVGTAASLEAAATAQTPAASPGAGGATFTGDTIQGRPVITALDVNALTPGSHRFYFQGVETVTGQHWYVSVAVLKGARPGKRALLTGGVHGDEMNSIRTIQLVMEQLDPAGMSGSVTAVYNISRPALKGMARRWPNSGRGIDLIDMNRQWPGNADGFSAPSRHAALLFEGYFRPNADFGHRLPHRRLRHGRNGLPHRRPVEPGGRRDGDALPDRPNLRRHRRLRRHPDERAHRRRHPRLHPRARQAARPRPRG